MLAHRRRMQNRQEEKTQPKSLVLGDAAILLAAVTAISYLILYMYTLGFYSFYNVPSMFIELDIKRYVGVIVILAVLLFIFTSSALLDLKELGFKNYQGIQMPPLPPVIVVMAILIASVFICLGGYTLWLYLFNDSSYSLFSPFVYLILLVLGLCVLAIVSKRKVIESLVILMLLVLLISMLISYGMGLMAASLKSRYTIIEMDKTEYVAIDQNKNTVLIAPIDTKKNEITPKFRFINIESDDKQTIDIKLKYVRPVVKIKKI